MDNPEDTPLTVREGLGLQIHQNHGNFVDKAFEKSIMNKYILSVLIS